MIRAGSRHFLRALKSGSSSRRSLPPKKLFPTRNCRPLRGRRQHQTSCRAWNPGSSIAGRARLASVRPVRTQGRAMSSRCFLESSRWWNMEQCFDRRRGTRQIFASSCAKTCDGTDGRQKLSSQCPVLPVVVAWRLRGSARRSETLTACWCGEI